MTWPIKHLTADDLDAFHSASQSVETQNHLDDCADCRALLAQDRALIKALERLPVFEPALGFGDRVMARIRVRAEVPVPAAQRKTLAFRPRLAMAAALMVTLGASIMWSLFNRSLLLSWINSSAAETGRSLWLGIRVVATNLTEQPWFASLRELVSSPGRLALLATGLLVVYTVALVGLRRLLTPPSRPVPDANW